MGSLTRRAFLEASAVGLGALAFAPRAHADRAERQPPGMARGLGRDRKEPPPYLGALGPFPAPPDLCETDAKVRRGRQGRPGVARTPWEQLGLRLEGRLLGPSRGRRHGYGELHLRHAPVHDEQPVLDLLASSTLLSKTGQACRVRSAVPLKVTARGGSVPVRRLEPGLIDFRTEPGATYRLTAADR